MDNYIELSNVHTDHADDINYKQALLDKLHDHTATIGIIGLGYVGLPLAVAFAQAGFQTVGLDVNQQKVDRLNKGESYIPDVPSDSLAPVVESEHFHATTSYDDLRDADAVIICVPTPLRKTKDPDMSYIIAAADEVEKIAHYGMLIVLESTTYPGTTEEVIAPRMLNNGFRIGENIFVAFSPERIDPGNPTYGLSNTPKVVGGMTPDCGDVVEALYTDVVGNVVRVSSTTAAEMVKLLENTFRAVNIGLVNEMALMCKHLDVDVWEVIDAASSKPFGFMPFQPGPGLGGHCIPIDPHYLSWRLRKDNYTARFIEVASDINASMPNHVLTLVSEALNEEQKSLNGAKIGILGMAYKRDIDDVRESPALDVYHLLQERGAQITYNDPYVPSARMHDGSLEYSTDLTEDWLQEQDCIIIVTNHQVYDYDYILDQARLVVDTRNVTNGNGAHHHARVVKL